MSHSFSVASWLSRQHKPVAAAAAGTNLHTVSSNCSSMGRISAAYQRASPMALAPKSLTPPGWHQRDSPSLSSHPLHLRYQQRTETSSIPTQNSCVLRGHHCTRELPSERSPQEMCAGSRILPQQRLVCSGSAQQLSLAHNLGQHRCFT